ncbi:MAG: hypothetical protein DRP65_04190 [Planctomycetota bacterium]|nr:MAG: hypothetical protein DRP65_04190 [Planctomycetota bacterium]
MAEKAFCPNCGTESIKEGKRITCEKCDAVFVVKKDGSHIESLGRLEDHERRLRALEGKGQNEEQPAESLDQDEDQPTEPTGQDEDQPAEVTDQEDDLW